MLQGQLDSLRSKRKLLSHLFSRAHFAAREALGNTTRPARKVAEPHLVAGCMLAASLTVVKAGTVHFKAVRTSFSHYQHHHSTCPGTASPCPVN